MLALVLAALLPLLPAEQTPAAPATPRPAPAAPVLPARSFTKLFTLQDLPGPSAGSKTIVTVPGSRARTKVVCGMTLIIVDNRADPKMVLSPRGGKDVDPAMPRVPKPMCGDR